MRFLKTLIKSNRPLLIELLFTAFTFVLMTVLSYWFLSLTVRENLERNMNAVLDFTEDRISDSTIGFESLIEGFAEETRVRMLNGDSAGEIEEYILNVSRFVALDSLGAFGVHDFWGYFSFGENTPVLLGGENFNIPADYKPEEQDWYRRAIEADGGLIETTPFVSADNETSYIYAKCIFDESGKRIGIVCLNANIDHIGSSVVETAWSQDGYGMIIGQDGRVLFHPNPDFMGISSSDPAIPISQYAGEILRGEKVTEQSVVSYTGEEAVVFLRPLKNGWTLGLVTPRNKYYSSITNMAFILSGIALTLAAILMGIQVRLDKARVKANEENQQKSVFLANMSHEIRTPINAIVGMTAIGKTSGTTERKDYCFAKIDDASRHLLGVINDILDISKIEANKIALSPTDFNFEKMLQQVVSVITFRLDEKRQKMTVYLDKRIPAILYADDQRFAQVITNLLSNAVKFTPEEGSVSLKTRLLGEEYGIYNIQVEVSDTGIGLSPEQQIRLFDAFEQAESSTTRKYGGTGLGLSISKKIVELMGGTIEVKSALGQGSTFTFTLKVSKGDDTKYGFAERGVNWGNIRILTVDDDVNILEYFQEIVKGFGANCEVAEDAKGALNLVDEGGAYNIYFVDLKMPGINGIELTKEIRAREKDPEKSIVIMISSADLSAVEDEARKAGVDKFLLKPLFPSAIADVINECIGIANEKEKETAMDIGGIFAGRNVLFAEDIEINREIVISLLEPTGISIDCAENGLEAVNMFRRGPEKYDLIFMDVQMPEMDGYDATRQIRSLNVPNAKTIPIIAMTANVFKEDVERCLASGMNDHIGKPLDMEDLINLMTRYLAAS
ncbi:MAG: response regulator [Clostridiales bacterium]|jgi:signal transduction histidine kinase/CheY-like chemotaxis protein|nr:response regulator [Clostridiales bacterium]